MKKILFFTVTAFITNYASAQSKSGAAESLIAIASVATIAQTQNKDEEAVILRLQKAGNKKQQYQ